MSDNLRDRLMALADQWERQGSIVPAPGYPHQPAVKVAVERIRALLAAPSEPADSEAGSAEGGLTLTDAEWREFQQIPDQGYSHRAWVDRKIADRDATRDAQVRADERQRVLGEVERRVRELSTTRTQAWADTLRIIQDMRGET
jgi:hypothetical protein